MKTQVCKKCGYVKDISEFYKSDQWKSGYNSSCIVCVQQGIKVSQKRKKERDLANQPEGDLEFLTKDGVRAVMKKISNKHNNSQIRESKPISVTTFYYDKVPNETVIEKDIRFLYRMGIKSNKSLIDVTNIDIEKYENTDMYKYEYTMWY